MRFTESQIQQLTDTVEYFNTIFIATNIGSDVLSQSDKNILTRNGFDWKSVKNDYPDYAFKFGIISAALKDERSKNMSFNQFKKFLLSGKFTPLSPQEQYTISIIKQQAYKDTINLKNKIVSDLYQISIDSAQKSRYQKIMKQEALKAVNDRISVSEFSKILSKKTGDWSRDFDRIADYILHSAYQHGKANFILNQQPIGAKVWFRVHKDACDHCKRVYLKNSSTSEPKIFYLKDVISNGSNIGIKPKDYKPTIYALHPYCRCELQQYIVNTVWNSVKKQFVVVRNTYGVNRKSKIKITYEQE